MVTIRQKYNKNRNAPLSKWQRCVSWNEEERISSSFRSKTNTDNPSFPFRGLG